MNPGELGLIAEPSEQGAAFPIRYDRAAQFADLMLQSAQRHLAEGQSLQVMCSVCDTNPQV